MTAPRVGPILCLDSVADGAQHLSALFVLPLGESPGPVTVAGREVQSVRLADFEQSTVWRARFQLPADRPASYRWNGACYPVAGDLTGDLRIAYVSCNGEETGDLDRDPAERNVMWARLCAEHRRQPFALLLHGGDQIYADEVKQGHALTEHWPDRLPSSPSPAALADLRQHLREGFLERYCAVYAAPEVAWLVARVPSLMQWDDHDICDGWGSLPEGITGSAVGQTLFSVAREAFLLFQQATVDGDLPARFADPRGRHLGWVVNAPRLRILAPDLRSERTRQQVMGAGGWAMMDSEAARQTRGQTLFLSSVPLLGPRLSILERLMVLMPRLQKYEDDLRDQWQSRAHRDEWCRILRLVRDLAHQDGHDITALSGEIHLATRAVMLLGDGLELKQLVASGISHRAPPVAWARVLGALAALGEDPLPEHPIRIHCLPGQRGRYVAERNYLVLERNAGEWSAWWELESGGCTAPIPL